MDRQKIDMKLINRCKAGDQKAFELLFNHYQKPVFYYIHAIVKDYQDAEDLTMVTFEKAFRQLNKYQPFFKFQTWLTKIAKTTSLDFFRFKKTRLYTDLELSLVYHIKNIENPENIIINKENVEILKLKISNLTQKRREIVKMRIMGMKCREIAQLNDISINTITGQLLHIKRKLAV